MNKIFSSEAKVGLFVIVSVALLVYLSVRITKTGFSLDRSRTAYFNFENASGILKRTPVEFAGIRVGFVEDIKLVDGKARVEVRIDPDAPIYQNSRVALANRGLLGEKIITVSQGSPPELPDGGVLQADPMAGDMDQAIKNFNEVAQSVKDLIRGGDGKPSIKDIIGNVNEMSEDLRTLIRANKQQLQDIVHNVNSFTGMLNNGDLREIIQNLKTSSETIKGFVADANPKLKDVVGDFKTIMGKVDTTVEALNRIVAKVDRGEGTVGKLLNDETTVNKMNETLDGVNEFVGRLQRLEVAVGFRGEYLSTAGEMQAVATFRFQPSWDKYFLFEFTDGPLDYSKRSTKIEDKSINGGAPTTTTTYTRKDNFQFTAIFARRFYDLVVKAGLMRSSGGLGAEYFLFKDHLSFGVDAFDFSREENPHLRLYAAAHLLKIFHLNAGVDDLLYEDVRKHRRRNYFAGLGIMLTDNDFKSLIGLAPLATSAGGN